MTMLIEYNLYTKRFHNSSFFMGIKKHVGTDIPYYFNFRFFSFWPWTHYRVNGVVQDLWSQIFSIHSNRTACIFYVLFFRYVIINVSVLFFHFEIQWNSIDVERTHLLIIFILFWFNFANIITTFYNAILKFF